MKAHGYIAYHAWLTRSNVVVVVYVRGGSFENFKDATEPESTSLGSDRDLGPGFGKKVVRISPETFSPGISMYRG